MAAKLSPTDTNVHVLTPRRAKGAKSTGGRKPAAVSKPKPGQARPAAAKQPSDADVRREKQDRMLALDHQIKGTENKLAIAQEAMTDLRTLKKQQRAALGAIYSLELYDDARKDAARKTDKVDLALREKERAEIREAFGLPAGPQAELALAKTPEAARPALYWEDMGRSVSQSGGMKLADPQRDGVPPENVQDYMRGYHDDQARIIAGMKGLAADRAAEPAPPLMVGEDPAKAAAKQVQRDSARTESPADAEPALVAPAQPDWTDFDADPDKWNELQKNVFLTWFAELGDDAVIIYHPGAEIMFDRCVAAEGSEDTAPPAEDVGREEPPITAGPAPAGVVYMLSADEPFASGRQATYRDGVAVDAEMPGPDWPIYDAHPGDGFEASAEELQQQGGRRAIQERRDAGLSEA